MTRLVGSCVCVLAALAAAPAALAAFPGPYGVQDGPGVLSKDGALRFVASKAGANTLVSAISTKDGSVVRTRMFAGQVGVPALLPGKPAEGLSRDGGTFVLQTMGFAPKTQFAIVRTADLQPVDSFTLNGTFAFDALSPNGSMLYLIQHRTISDVEHYIVRGYDLEAHTLLPGRIADKTQKSWVMQGWAVNRTTTPSGRWVYTLYANPGGYPFIHALDTVRGVAHCIGVPWPATEANQEAVFNFSLALKGKSLVVERPGGVPYRYVDTTNWKVTKQLQAR